MPSPAVTVVTSDDVGAPDFMAAADSMIEVLDFILVTKGAWAKVHSGTHKAAYRAPGGSVRHYLRVEDGTNAFGTIVAACRGYESMSDVDTGTNPYATADDQHTQGTAGAG